MLIVLDRDQYYFDQFVQIDVVQHGIATCHVFSNIIHVFAPRIAERGL